MITNTQDHPLSSHTNINIIDPPLSENQVQLLKTASILETSRSLRAEHEASLLFALSLLSNNVIEGGSSAGLSSEAAQALPASVKDAWAALIQNADYSGTSSEPVDESLTKTPSTNPSSSMKMEYSLPHTRGQLIKALFTGALSASFERAAELAKMLQQTEKENASVAIETLRAIALSQEQQDEINSQSAPAWIMQAFYHRVGEIREYHAKHAVSSTLHAGTSSTSSSSMEAYDSTLTHAVVDSNYHPSEPTHDLLPPLKKAKRVSNPMADGYDLHSLIDTHLQKIQMGDFYSTEEVYGKYFDFSSIFQNMILSSDLNSIFLSAIHPIGKHHQGKKLSYHDFLNFLLEPHFVTSISEDKKLLHRKKYIRFLCAMKDYLMGFIHRVTPLLDIEADVVGPALSLFVQEWSKKGGIVPGWECKPAEATWASTIRATHSVHSKIEDQNIADGNRDESTPVANTEGLDLSKYSSAEELNEAVEAGTLKVELSRLGLKCGGTPLERAKRLWLTKDTPLDQLPPKLFVKPPTKPSSSSTDVAVLNMDTFHIDSSVSTQELRTQSSEMNETYHVPSSFVQNSRRIDIAYLETIVMALIDQVRPTLDATARRAERRLTQTVGERERELMDEILGSASTLDKGKRKDKKGDDEDDDDEEDEPIYNPKGVPLGWDGKPIPFWLYKLHGLNFFFPCEICGNESYRGRRNFEKHFTETKHAYGMRCLNIPNTNHFHGVTSIEDAQALWAKLQKTVSKDKFDGSKEEEYEDSQGNVLSRSQYEDLARQGLL